MTDGFHAKEFCDLIGPRKMGPYRLLRILGRGGMGVVYLAEREGDASGPVALKRADHSRSHSAERRLVREAEILGSLNHPNIARILDHGQIDGSAYLVTEYIDGPSVDRYAQALDMRDRVSCFRQIAAAIEHAHRHGIIHRDLKPSNILVNGAGEVKVLDFGIARQIESPLTETTLVPISLLYAAPEQFSGGAITKATDIYALGVLLHQCVAGRHPFQRYASTIESATRAVLEAKPDDLDDAGLNRIARKAMRKKPEERYGSVREMAYDLDCWLAGRYVVPRVRSRGRYAHVALAAAVLVATAVAAVQWKRASVRAEHRSQIEELDRYLRVTYPDWTVPDWAPANRILKGLVPQLGRDAGSTKALVLMCLRASGLYENQEPQMELLRKASVLSDRLSRMEPSNEGLAISSTAYLGWVWHGKEKYKALDTLRAAANRASGWKPETPEDLEIARKAYTYIIECTNSMEEKRHYGRYLSALLQNPEGIVYNPVNVASDLAEAQLWDDSGRILDGLLPNEDSSNPDSTEWWFVHNILAGVRKNQGRYEQALEEYRKTRALVRKKDTPEHRRRMEGITAHGIGDMLEHLGRHEESEAEFRRALRIRHEIVADYPDNPDLVHELSSTLYIHARNNARRHPMAALREVREGLELRKRVHVLDPTKWENHLDWELPDLQAQIEAGMKGGPGLANHLHRTITLPK
jgi:tetratricopeptide (TPR) repeat protein